jgi:formate dehydrogenase accessory protein FdhD
MKPKAEMEKVSDRKGVVLAIEHSAAVERQVNVWSCESNGQQNDVVAEEVAIALVYNGISHAVMMASPKELEAFAVGFSLTEGIINCSADILAIDIVKKEVGIEVDLTISSRRFMQLKHRRRSLTGRTGCGICGAESLEQARPDLAMVKACVSINHAAVNLATATLSLHQPLQALTGALHGAAWCDIEGNILKVCEDVGRHNALDKLIGSLWPLGNIKQPGFLLMSSRASYEIVQKAAKVGIAVVAAVSAPTSLAIDVADTVGITLIGFSRQNRHIVYTHAQRITE